MGVFDYVNSIHHKKNNMMRDTENDDLAEKLYEPYITNRALSQFVDTVLYANEMNARHEIDNKLQYEYFLNSIRAQKRFTKWAKRDESDDIDIICEYYNYSYTKAYQALSALSKQDILEIRKKLDKGG
tara:strand:- start:1208 stop:1591 length:384 start_codon:yes stop_codon:yes gene_type:complete